MNALHFATCGGHVEIVKYLTPKFGDRKFHLTNASEGHSVILWTGPFK